MRDYEEKSYYEIQLDNKQLILVFLAGVTVCVLIFILGVMVGKGKKEAEIASLTRPEAAAPQVTEEESSEPMAVAQDTEPGEGKKPKKSARAPKPEEKLAIADLDKPEPASEPVVEKKKVEAEKPKAEPAEETQPEAPGGAKRYTVQVMATASQEKAEQQLSLLKQKGYTAFMDEDKSASGSVFKVRVGRFSDPESAKKIAGRLKQDLKLETWVAVLD